MAISPHSFFSLTTYSYNPTEAYLQIVYLLKDAFSQKNVIAAKEPW
jgi:hypothetical protein